MAQALLPLQERLQRADKAFVGWRFPDTHTLVLQLVGEKPALWIDLRPPQPQVAWWERPFEPATRPPTGFQALLSARAQGALLAVEQAALDRRFQLRFAASSGFVPGPPVILEVELTGRNANAILTDHDGLILGVWRDIGHEVNRYREVRPGIAYRPPPPYQKPDPRTLSAADLRARLLAERLRDAPRLFDGIGPRLSLAWAALAEVDPAVPLTQAEVPRVLAASVRLFAEPAACVGARANLDAARAERQRALALGRLRVLLEARALRSERQLEDADVALARASSVAVLRAEADLLMAYPQRVARGAKQVTLLGFDGEPLVLNLDSQLSAVQNAERRYASARRQASRAQRARERHPALRAEYAAAVAQRDGLDSLADDALQRLLRELEPPSVKGAERRAGVWLRGPHGFEVVVGRNARENEAVTFRVGRSLDTWLHAQGVTGSHVIIRSGGREVPADTLRFAAELAAGHAQVSDETTALVDYTQRKHVWKVKGMPAGAVHYAHQRTLAVTPRRMSEVTREEEAAAAIIASHDPHPPRGRR